MKKLIFTLFVCFVATSVQADVDEFVNIKKISKLSKTLVEKQKNVDANDLEVDFISTMASPKAGFVQVEVNLYQISSKKKLTPKEIEELIPKETKPEKYNHYKITTYTAMFNDKKIDEGFVIKGEGIINEPKKP